MTTRVKSRPIDIFEAMVWYRLPAAVAWLMVLYGRTVASFFLLCNDLGEVEKKYLNELGVPRSARGRVARAMLAQGIWNSTALMSLIFWLLFLSELGDKNPPSVTGDVLAVTIGATALAVVSSAAVLSPRQRLLASVGRAVRLLSAVSPTAPPRGFDLLYARWLSNPHFRRRRVVGVAWALTRDTAKLTARPVTDGDTVGELLLWWAALPADARRRPVVSAVLVEVLNSLETGIPLPHAQFGPAARFRSRSPRERVGRQIRTLAGGALTTGVLIAIATAVLRLVIR